MSESALQLEAIAKSFLSGEDRLQVLNGASVLEAFRTAAGALTQFRMGQSPILDDNGNGVFDELLDGLVSRNYSIGAGILRAGDDPVVGPVSSPAVVTSERYDLEVRNVTTTGFEDKTPNNNACDTHRKHCHTEHFSSKHSAAEFACHRRQLSIGEELMNLPGT